MNGGIPLRRIAAWLSAAYLAWTVAPMGWVKFDPDGFWTPAFERWGYPVWLRILVGAIEVGAGIGILVPRFTAYAAAALAVVLAGAWLTRFNDGRFTDVAWLSFYLALLGWIIVEFRDRRWRLRTTTPARTDLASAALLSVCAASLLAGCTAPAPAPPGPDLEANRAVVLAFYKEALTDKQPRSAFARYMTADFVEHKPDVDAGTREATAAFLDALVKELPDARWEVLRTVAEGDLVFLHARFTPAADAPPYAIADLFRLRDGRIVEHWDVVAGPPAQSRSPNSRF